MLAPEVKRRRTCRTYLPLGRRSGGEERQRIFSLEHDTMAKIRFKRQPDESGTEQYTGFNLTRECLRDIQLGRMRQYLEHIGWVESAVMGRPVDGNGDPLPWYTYPCSTFLKRRVNKQMHVFEFGSGYSTLWWSKRVASVTSCEHDKAFVEEISKQAPPNVTYLLRERGPEGRYAAAVAEQGRTFDIVIVDGRDRGECGIAAMHGLNAAGIIIWDNALRVDEEALGVMSAHGFRRLDFSGFGPIWTREWVTSIFYRNDNCLGI